MELAFITIQNYIKFNGAIAHLKKSDVYVNDCVYVQYHIVPN